MPEQLRRNVLHHSDAANAAGTLLVKDGSHVAHERFFETASKLTPEEKSSTGDFYKFHPEVQPPVPASTYCLHSLNVKLLPSKPYSGSYQYLRLLIFADFSA